LDIWKGGDEHWIKKCQQLVVEGKASRRRGRKTWLECVRRDMKELGLKVDNARDREIWKDKISVKNLSLQAWIIDVKR